MYAHLMPKHRIYGRTYYISIWIYREWVDFFGVAQADKQEAQHAIRWWSLSWIHMIYTNLWCNLWNSTLFSMWDMQHDRFDSNRLDIVCIGFMYMRFVMIDMLNNYVFVYKGWKICSHCRHFVSGTLLLLLLISNLEKRIWNRANY